MPDWPEYELIDFGDGRKLERIGQAVFDRPAPQTDAERKQHPALWSRAVAKYTGDKVGSGRWRFAAGNRPAPHCIRIPLSAGSKHRSLQMQIAPSPTGQVGVFPEQFANWQWVARRVARAAEPLRVLNLFGYTGGSTLAAAAAGGEVTHVDASKPAVAMARANADLSDLADAPIRWIVEDAVKYCQREVRRDKRYHAVILDPPTYGHGPKGEEWRLERDLPKLLKLCRELTQDDRRFLLATCHTPGIGPAELAAYLAAGIFGHCAQPPNSGRLWLATPARRRLDSGVYARWPEV